jgi:hypothetical protein
LRNIRWTSATQLDFDVDVGATAGTIIFTVNASSALSANNLVNLDGNQNPQGQNGVAANKDDFQWTVTCQNSAGARIHSAPSAAAPALRDPGPMTNANTLTLGAPLTGTIIVEPELLLIAEPSSRANGLFQIENQGDQLDVALFVGSDLQATGAPTATTTPTLTIPAAALTVTPLVAALPPGARTPVALAIDVPAGQPSAIYTGIITVTSSIADAQRLPVQLVVNHTPVLTVPVTQSVRVGQTLTMTVTTSDRDAEPILLHVEGLPDGDAESLSTFVDNGDGTATFTLTPDASMIGSTVSVSFIASNIYPYPADQIADLDFPPFIPHRVQDLDLRVLGQNDLYLPLIQK